MPEMDEMELLFSGTPQPFGGLSNEKELVDACPLEFRGCNVWSSYTRRLFLEGGGNVNWKWASEDEEERKRQAACFCGIFGSMSLGLNDKMALAGWMLSHMLSEVPEVIPCERK